jgi:hypothetical protein
MRHLSDAERYWFRQVMAGEDAPARYRQGAGDDHDRAFSDAVAAVRDAGYPLRPLGLAVSSQAKLLPEGRCWQAAAGSAGFRGHDLTGQGRDRGNDQPDGVVGYPRFTEGRDQMPGHEIKMNLAYPPTPVRIPDGRAAVRLGTAERSRKKLDLPALEPG